MDSEATEFVVSYGLIPDEKNEIALLTSSILEIRSELSWHVDVPPAHVEAGRALMAFDAGTAFDRPLFHVRYAESKSEATYVSVYERGVRYFLDDSDLMSKRTFALLQVLFSLTESAEASRGPVVTIGS